MYPTPSRLSLLDEIARGEVLVSEYGEACYSLDDGLLTGPWGHRVTAKWQEMERAGWVRRTKSKERWAAGELTTAGKAVLKDNADD